MRGIRWTHSSWGEVASDAQSRRADLDSPDDSSIDRHLRVGNVKQPSELRAQRSNSPCSVAIIDLDFFKRINDQFGHATGDEALRTFAISLFANIRTIDKLARYGGEEFLLILPNTAKDQAVRTLDRLRSIVSELDWAAISGKMNLTMSAGICSVRQADSAADLLARADTALYRAKDAGRNRVMGA